jgi:hypothetical protein
MIIINVVWCHVMAWDGAGWLLIWCLCIRERSSCLMGEEGESDGFSLSLTTKYTHRMVTGLRTGELTRWDG